MITSKITAALVLFVAPVAFGQWTSSGTGSTYLTGPAAGDKVGIGTSTPAAKLDVGGGWSGMPNAFGVYATFSGDAFFGLPGGGRMRVSSNAFSGFFQWNVYYDGSGLKLADKDQPGFELDLSGSAPHIPENRRDRIAFKRYAPSPNYLAPPVPVLVVTGNGRVGVQNEDPLRTLDVGGDIGVVNIVASGTIEASEVIGATYQDIAEWVPTIGALAAGTVVVLNREGVNEVMASSLEYDSGVAGVVTDRPGILLGRAGASKSKIATYGRVKVRADASRLPIRAGELLVTSNKTGTAMRSEPMLVNGRPFHQPGTIIGKALEPLSAGEGEILVLLSLQ